MFASAENVALNGQAGPPAFFIGADYVRLASDRRAAVEEKLVIVRLANTEAERNSARLLLNTMYDWRGYGADHEIPNKPRYHTFTAHDDGGDLIGTLSLGIDSPAGLSLDEHFRTELDEYRNSGRAICELTKFAFHTELPSKPLLASLFHIIFIFGSRRYGCTDLFIEVNPRHVRFYEAMLGFEKVGALKENETVGAPAQLMRLEISTIRQRIIEEAGKNPARRGRSLYAFFFSEVEEQGIYTRLCNEWFGKGAEILQHAREHPAPTAHCPYFPSIETGMFNGMENAHSTLH